MILEQTNCTVRMYDVRKIMANPAQLLKLYGKRVSYNKYGIGETSNSTLKALMTENGHNFIDIVKIDIESDEWNTLSTAVTDFPGGLPIGQLQVEIHTGRFKRVTPTNFSIWYQSLENAGLRPFCKEANNPDSVYEYSFLNLKFGMFKMDK